MKRARSSSPSLSQAEALLRIPQFTEKWFSKDRYEFSVEQWEEFSQRLNFLAIELRNNLVEHIGWLKDWTEHMATLDGKISAETEVKQQAQKLDSDFYKLYKVLTPTKQSDK